jgi:cyclopropane-fatty-acyl-phospholipid synthase
LLARLFTSIVRRGSLVLIKHDGSRMTFGRGSPTVAIKLHDRRAPWELALNPELKFGELYMDGRLTAEQGDIADVLDLLMTNLASARPGGMFSFLSHGRRLLKRLAQ